MDDGRPLPADTFGIEETSPMDTKRDATDLTNLERFAALAEQLITELCRASPDIQEGTVKCHGVVPYRRIDCDRRTLAYIRARPRKEMVRIDLSGLWNVPRKSRLLMRESSSAATLILRSAEDKAEAIAFLLEAVAQTRRASESARRRELERKRRRGQPLE
jgi:hypothetical protein